MAHLFVHIETTDFISINSAVFYLHCSVYEYCYANVVEGVMEFLLCLAGKGWLLISNVPLHISTVAYSCTFGLYFRSFAYSIVWLPFRHIQ